MRTHASFHPLTLAHAFEQFLEASSFARRTRESYTEDLKPLLAEVGQQPIMALTADVLQAFLARQESLAVLATCGIRQPKLASKDTSCCLLLLADSSKEEYNLKH